MALWKKTNKTIYRIAYKNERGDLLYSVESNGEFKVILNKKGKLCFNTILRVFKEKKSAIEYIDKRIKEANRLHRIMKKLEKGEKDECND
jgi:hypothetical protein